MATLELLQQRWRNFRAGRHRGIVASDPVGPRGEEVAAFGDDAPVLFVDADGTLYRGDLLHECVIRCILADPLNLFRIPCWILRGPAYLKHQVAGMIPVDLDTLPYRDEVLELLKVEAERGRMLVLTTAAHETYARRVADRLGCFHHVLATTENSNLRGHAKAEAIAGFCQALKCNTFSYIGDAHADLPVWRKAVAVYAVAPGWALRARIRALGKPTKLVGPRPNHLAAVLKALRPQQWAKNLLIFVPLMSSHRVFDWPALVQCGVAFVAFSLVASSVYIANDLVDIEADRNHPRKRLRPFASGALPVAAGPPLVLALLGAGLGVAYNVTYAFLATIGIYLSMNVAYSFWLKRKLLADVIALSLMYAIRIVSGGEAAGVAISEWLLAFSLFFFTSLALVKRHAELAVAEPSNGRRLASRAYRAEDLRIIEGLGPSSGLVAVLVLALYIASPEVKVLYRSPEFLWLLCPVLYFWIARIWILSGRHQLHHDPVVFAMTDWRSLATWAVSGGILILATFL